MKYDYALIESYIHERGHALDAFFKSAGISTSLFNQWKKGEKIPKHAALNVSQENAQTKKRRARI